MSDELHPRLADLYSRERASEVPSSDERRALRTAIGATLGIAATSATASAVAAQAAAATGSVSATGAAASLGVVAKITIAVALIGGIGGGSYLVTRAPSSHVASAPPSSGESAPARSVAPVSPPVVVEEAVPPPAPPVPAPQPSKRPPRATASPSSARANTPPIPTDPAPVAPTTPTESQGAMLSRAWSLLAAGNASDALALADTDAAAHPNGVLVEERTALRIDALVKLGRTDEAKVAAREFLSLFPNSIHRPSIERVLEP